MELKLWIASRLIKSMRVLIVPLWNWNLLQPSRGLRICGSNCTFMELKSGCRSSCPPRPRPVLIVPLWNWNCVGSTALGGSPIRSNCTFMELKCLSRTPVSRAPLVLIVPLWNWNEQNMKQHLPLTGSNCTFMELKYDDNLYVGLVNMF